jgi:ribosomal protein S18 acetylase RimI-like enzyme
LAVQFGHEPTPVRAVNDDGTTRREPRIEVVEATSPEQLAAFASLVRAFVAWCRDRYAERAWAVDTYFGAAALEQELATLPGKYAPPGGALLLALVDGAPAGCVAFRALGDGTCEMKRLFVSDACRGLGLGSRLANVLIGLARACGFAAMRLETGDKQPEALALYRALGFREVAPYYDAPADLLSYLTFMELKL